MRRRGLSDPLVREVPLLSSDDRVGHAVRRLVEAGVPALPVADRAGRLCGIFGEREFFAALFPGYLAELSSAEKRAACRTEEVRAHMNTERVDVGAEFSDAQVAETFLHHSVPIIPVVDDARVLGIITRGDFFEVVAQRFLAAD